MRDRGDLTLAIVVATAVGAAAIWTYSARRPEPARYAPDETPRDAGPPPGPDPTMPRALRPRPLLTLSAPTPPLTAEAGPGGAT